MEMDRGGSEDERRVESDVEDSEKGGEDVE